MSYVSEKKNEGSIFSVVGLAAAGFGFYAGMIMLIPLFAAFAIGALYEKFAAREKRIWKTAIAVQGGHAVWFIIGLISLGVLNINAGDPLLLIAGMVWLYIRPGAWPVAVIGMLQILAVGYNISLVLETDFGTSNNKALLVHIAFRFLAIGAMGYGLYLLKKRSVNEDRISE